MTAVERVSAATAGLGVALLLVLLIVAVLGHGHGGHYELLSAIFSDDCTKLRITEDAGGDIQQSTPVWLTVFDLQKGDTVYRSSFPTSQSLVADIALVHPLHFAQVMIYHSSYATDVPFVDYAVALVQVYCTSPK